MDWDSLPKFCKWCGAPITWFGAGNSLYCFDLNRKSEHQRQHNCRSKNPDRIELSRLSELENYYLEDLKGNLKIIKNRR